MSSPNVTIVSPTPGVPVGDPGGFPRSFARAKATPIVVEITDDDDDIAFMMIAARFPNEQIEEDGDDPGENEEVVYRAGQFRGKYVANSHQESIPTGFRLHIGRRGGWPRGDDGQVASVVFAVEALDAGGTVEIKMDGTPVGTAEAIDFIGATVADEGGGVVSVTIEAGGGSVVFDDAVEADHRNIRSDRATAQSPIDNTKVGIVNLGNATGAIVSTGCTANYSAILSGNDNSASGEESVVIGGSRHNVSGDESSAVGFRNTVSGDISHSSGFNNVVGGDGANVGGNANTVGGDYALVGGRTNTVNGDNSLVGGRDNVVAGSSSFASGETNTASGGSSAAMGTSCVASSSNAFAHGNDTNATGPHSHAEGTQTTASGQHSHAEGNLCVASGYASHAEGQSTTASANFSKSSGYRSKATRETQVTHAGGRINANGDVQTSLIHMYMPTASAPIGGSTLQFGDSPLSSLVLEDNKAYAVRVHALAAGGSGGAISASITRNFVLRMTGGVASVVASGVQTVIGHATAVASWAITTNAAGDQVQFLFGTGADITTTDISVSARVEFDEAPIAA